MNTRPQEIRSRTEAREWLVFLIENRIQKGRLSLLYQLYRSEIHSLSLAGAAKFISRDLGYPVGIQTIRTVRKKSEEWGEEWQTEWEKKESYFPRVLSAAGNENPAGATSSTLGTLEGFKPLDIFSEEFIKQQSTIKWAQTNKA